MIKKDQEIFTKCVTIRTIRNYVRSGFGNHVNYYYKAMLFGAVMGSRGKLIWRPIQDLGSRYRYFPQAEMVAREYSEKNNVPIFERILCGMEVGETLGALLE